MNRKRFPKAQTQVLLSHDEQHYEQVQPCGQCPRGQIFGSQERVHTVLSAGHVDAGEFGTGLADRPAKGDVFGSFEL